VYIYIRSPLVRLDVVGAALEAAVALGEVGRQQLLDNGLGVAVHEPREHQLARQDLDKCTTNH
jgi:hypothetical protein